MRPPRTGRRLIRSWEDRELAVRIMVARPYQRAPEEETWGLPRVGSAAGRKPGRRWVCACVCVTPCGSRSGSFIIPNGYAGVTRPERWQNPGANGPDIGALDSLNRCG